MTGLKKGRAPVSIACRSFDSLSFSDDQIVPRNISSFLALAYFELTFLYRFSFNNTSQLVQLGQHTLSNIRLRQSVHFR
jgi:hypothetical protein